MNCISQIATMITYNKHTKEKEKSIKYTHTCINDYSHLTYIQELNTEEFNKSESLTCSVQKLKYLADFKKPVAHVTI